MSMLPLGCSNKSDLAVIIIATFAWTFYMLPVSIAETPGLFKAIAFFLVWLILWLPIAVPVAKGLNWQPFQPLKVEQKLPLLASLYLIAPLIIWGAVWVEKGSFTNFGLSIKPSGLISLGLGISIGICSLVVIFGIQWLLGWLEWRWQAEDQLQSWGLLIKSVVLPTLLIALLISGIEELIFRGFLLNELRQDYSIWVAAGISSLIFALLHLVWEQKETFPQLPGLWLMGMILVFARWVDNGSLGLACGLHAGWILGIATIDTAQLIIYTGKVPAGITGLNQKPLAGVAGIICLLATSLLLWGLGIKN